MTADSCRDVECNCGFDSFHSSHSRRSETGRLRECRPAPATGRVQTQRSAAKTEEPRSIVLGRPLPDLAGLGIRVDIRASGNRNVLASRTVQTVLAEVISSETPCGRPRTRSEIRKLIHTMAIANPTWGAPRVHGELKKLGFKISERTVSRLMPKKTGKPSQTWMTFLRNHVGQMVSVDFFTVPTTAPCALCFRHPRP
jgi:hypothetical protein